MQLCPLGDTTLMHITISALPLARLDRIEFSFQSWHLPDYFIGFSLQPCHLPEYYFTHCHLSDFIALISVISPAICQTLLRCFYFTAVLLPRLYLADFSLHSCHSSDLMALVSVYSHATGQSLFHWFQFAVLTLVRLYFMVTVSSSPP